MSKVAPIDVGDGAIARPDVGRQPVVEHIQLSDHHAQPTAAQLTQEALVGRRVEAIGEVIGGQMRLQPEGMDGNSGGKQAVEDLQGHLALRLRYRAVPDRGFIHEFVEHEGCRWIGLLRDLERGPNVVAAAGLIPRHVATQSVRADAGSRR